MIDFFHLDLKCQGAFSREEWEHSEAPGYLFQQGKKCQYCFTYCFINLVLWLLPAVNVSHSQLSIHLELLSQSFVGCFKQFNNQLPEFFELQYLYWQFLQGISMACTVNMIALLLAISLNFQVFYFILEMNKLIFLLHYSAEGWITIKSAEHYKASYFRLSIGDSVFSTLHTAWAQLELAE